MQFVQSEWQPAVKSLSPHDHSSHEIRGRRWSPLEADPWMLPLSKSYSRALAFLQADIVQTDLSSVLLTHPFENDVLETRSFQRETAGPPAVPSVPLPEDVPIVSIPLHKHLDLPDRVPRQLVSEGETEVA